jgi:hypothetical protein
MRMMFGRADFVAAKLIWVVRMAARIHRMAENTGRMVV